MSALGLTRLGLDKISTTTADVSPQRFVVGILGNEIVLIACGLMGRHLVWSVVSWTWARQRRLIQSSHMQICGRLISLVLLYMLNEQKGRATPLGRRSVPIRMYRDQQQRVEIIVWQLRAPTQLHKLASWERMPGGMRWRSELRHLI